MNYKSLKNNTNFWIVLGTLVVLAIAYIFYLNYYRAGKEDRITSTRFRVLDQIGDNIDSKALSYTMNGEEIKGKISKLRDTNPLARIVASVQKEDINPDLNIVLTRDTLAEDVIREYGRTNYIVPGEDGSLWRKSGDSVVIIEVPYEKLVQGFVRNDVFDGLILIRDSVVIFNTRNQDMILTNIKMVDQINEISKHDTKKKNESDTSQGSLKGLNGDLFFSGKAFDLVISNITYRAFLKPVHIRGETWFILGLMDSVNYEQASRSIAPMVIISLSLVLIIIILALPVIKLKVISITEHLETGTIVSLALSGLLGGALLVLFALFLVQHISHSLERDHHLQELSEQISTSLKDEITEVYNQLETYDHAYNDSTLKIDVNPNNSYQTKVRIDILNGNPDSIYYPRFYEFGDYYFWVNEEGMQSAYMTPFKEYGTFSNLGSRDYVTKNDEWFFIRDEAGKKKDTVKFRLESIVSITSGSAKVAMSMPGQRAQDTVVALSSKFYSIIDPIIPRDYLFCIVDPTGKVWFHSDIKRNLKENFISECNGSKQLSAAIYRRIPKTISVWYYNNPYRICVSPIEQLPLYIITLYNKRAERSFQAQVISFTLFLLGIFFLMLFLQTVVLLMINPRKQWPPDLMTLKNLTRPKKHQNQVYRYLRKIMTGGGLLFIVYMLELKDIEAVLGVFVFAVWLYMYAHWVLNRGEKMKRTRHIFQIVNGILLLAINSAGYILIRLDLWKVIGFQAMLIIMIAILHSLMFRKKEEASKENEFSRNYNRMLVRLLIIFGILPSLKFYEVANNKELEIQTRHMQVNLMMQREARNMRISGYYDRMNITDKIREIQQKRDTLGIYTRFLDHTYFDPDFAKLKKDSESQNQSYWDTLISFIRPIYDDYNLQNKYIILNSNIDAGMQWDGVNEDTLKFQYLSLTEDPEKRSIRHNTIITMVPRLSFVLPYPPTHSDAFTHKEPLIFNVLFWIAVFGILYLAYLLIQFGTDNIFGLSILEQYTHQRFLKRVHRYLLAGHKLMIKRLSPTDKTDYFIKKFSETFESINLDWSDNHAVRDSIVRIENALSEYRQSQEGDAIVREDQIDGDKRKMVIDGSLVVLINNFDHACINPEVLSRKLRIIKEVFELDGILPVLMTQAGLQRLKEFYQDLITGKHGDDDDVQVYKKLHLALDQLERELHVVEQPVHSERSWESEDEENLQSAQDSDLKELLNRELQATDYLKTLDPAMQDYLSSSITHEPEKQMLQDLIRRILNLAEPYYSDLFHSCSFQEKQVLYDFADDLIVNTKNKDAIRSLLEKGILIKEYDRLSFFNISFRSFILNKMAGSQVLETEEGLMKDSGTWKGYRLMIILVIVALFVFIAMSKQDFFDNLNKLFVLIAGGIASITGILELLSRQNKSGR